MSASPSPPPRPSAPSRGLWWRALVAGAVAGAVLCTLDAALAYAHNGRLLSPARDFCLFGAGVGGALGLVAALVCARAARPLAALRIGIVALGAWYLAAGAFVTHVAPLSSLVSPTSLGLGAVLAVVAFLASRRVYRTANDRMRPVLWVAVGVAAGAASWMLDLDRRPPEGPEPVALQGDGAPRPNVLVYLIDTLRADHLGTYGYERPTSPDLDAFASDATVFDTCWAPSSWTLPSSLSLFVSLFPTTHGCARLEDVLAPEADTLAEVLRACGWRTAGFCDNLVFSSNTGSAQGFDEWLDRPPSLLPPQTIAHRVTQRVPGADPLRSKGSERGCRALHEAALEFIDRTDDRPWFAYVHVMEPHYPYEPPDDCAEAMGCRADPSSVAVTRAETLPGLWPWHASPPLDDTVRDAAISLYDGEILDVTRGFGELIDGLRERGELENTIVIVVSDHGEEFYEHGGWDHGRTLFRELAHVPFVLRLADALGESARGSRGRRVTEPVSLVDVMPTLLDLLRVGAPSVEEWPIRGRSVAPLVRGEPMPELATERPMLVQLPSHLAYRRDKLQSVREGRWLFIEGASQDGEPVTALYDTEADPGEQVDLHETEPDVVERLRKLLQGCLRVLESGALTAGKQEFDEGSVEDLRALGYLGGK